MEDNATVEMENGDQHPTLLFRSLLAALPGADAVQYEDVDQAEPAVRDELDDWWSNSPLTDSLLSRQARYECFYRQLVAATKELIAGFNEDGDDADTSSTIAQFIDSDWGPDQHLLHNVRAFGVFALAAAKLMVLRHQPEDRNKTSMLAAVKTLRQRSSGADEIHPLAVVKKPRTMAEKLAHMRTQRTMLVKAGSTANIIPLSSSPEPSVVAATGVATPVDSIPSGALLQDGDDGVAHYFSIETRQELKEKLQALQQRLDALLLETKFAWMKCFCTTTTTAVGETQDPPHELDNECGVASAKELVAQGETLATHLVDAFRKARKATCPIHEYKALVATCEQEFDVFVALVSEMAAAPSPVRTKKREIDALPAEPVAHSEPTGSTKPRPMAFDLPSMKTYYEKAAPSYAAYLPQKKR